VICYKDMVFGKNKDVERFDLEEGTALLDTASDRLLVINEVALVIFELLADDNIYKIEEVGKRILEKFDNVTDENVEKDIIEFLESLISRDYAKKG